MRLLRRFAELEAFAGKPCRQHGVADAGDLGVRQLDQRRADHGAVLAAEMHERFLHAVVHVAEGVGVEGLGGTKPPLPNFGKTVTRDPETDVLCTLILSGFKTSCRTHRYQVGVSRSSPSDECLKRDHPSPLLKQLAEKLFQIANKLDETAIIVVALELSQFLLSVGDRSPRQHIIMSIQSFLYFMTKRRPCFPR